MDLYFGIQSLILGNLVLTRGQSLKISQSNMKLKKHQIFCEQVFSIWLGGLFIGMADKVVNKVKMPCEFHKWGGPLVDEFHLSLCIFNYIPTLDDPPLPFSLPVNSIAMPAPGKRSRARNQSETTDVAFGLCQTWLMLRWSPAGTTGSGSME